MYFIELESDGHHVRLTSWRNGGDSRYPAIFQKDHLLFGESNFFPALFSQCFSLFQVVDVLTLNPPFPTLNPLILKLQATFGATPKYSPRTKRSFCAIANFFGWYIVTR